MHEKRKIYFCYVPPTGISSIPRILTEHRHSHMMFQRLITDRRDKLVLPLATLDKRHQTQG